MRSKDGVRVRGSDSLKFEGMEMEFTEAFEDAWGEFGKLWQVKIKDGALVLPSMKEVVDGFYDHYREIVAERSSDAMILK